MMKANRDEQTQTIPNLKTFEAVISGKIKDGQFRGREYARIPVIALREGVLFGSNYSEPQLVPASEIEKTAAAWNGRPLTRRHPEMNGQLVPAGDPAVFDTQVVGIVFQSEFTQDKLKMEAWIDKEYGADIIERAENAKEGEKIEVSTGYFSNDEDAGGEFKGQSYGSIQRNIVPDHLAILAPNEKGACSWEDGCGAMRVNVRSTARRPHFSGTENTSWGDVSTTFSAYAKGYLRSTGSEEEPPSSVEDAPPKMKQWIAQKTLLGDAGADNERDLIFFPVVNPGTLKLNRGALVAVLGGRGSQADIPDAAKKSARNMARNLLDSEFGDKQNTGILSENILDDQLADEETTTEICNSLNNNTKYVISVHLNHAYYWDYSSEKLFKVHFSANGKGEFSFNSEPEEVKAMTKMVTNADGGEHDTKCNGCNNKQNECACDSNKVIENIMANEANEFSKEELESMKLDTLKKISNSLKAKAEKKPDEPPKDNSAEEERKGLVKEILNSKQNTVPEDALNQLDVNALKAVLNTVKEQEAPANMNAEEFVKNHVPAELRDVLMHGLKTHQDQTEELIKSITDNEHNDFTKEELRKMDFNTLKRMARLAEKEDYSANSVVNGSGDNDDESRPPEPPKMNFEQKAEA